MPNLYPAEEELKNAKQELQFMKDSDPFEEAERHWRNFLNHLDKCWIKAVIGCSDIEGKFQSIKSYVQNKQKKDPLILYLSQARDADNHSVQTLASLEIVSNIPADFITLTTHNVDGTYLKTETHPIFPSNFIVSSFTNRGKIYTPPIYHLGKTIKKHTDPYILGNLGIEFYEEQINKAKIKIL